LTKEKNNRGLEKRIHHLILTGNGEISASGRKSAKTLKRGAIECGEISRRQGGFGPWEQRGQNYCTKAKKGRPTGEVDKLEILKGEQ